MTDMMKNIQRGIGGGGIMGLYPPPPEVRRKCFTVIVLQNATKLAMTKSREIKEVITF